MATEHPADILPRGKDSATGVALPPKALVGTAQELDAHLEEYLSKYAMSLGRVADVVANAAAELKSMEDAASAQARKAVDDKGKAQAGTGKPGARPPAPARLDLADRLVDDDDAGAHEDDEGAGALVASGGAGEAPTTQSPGTCGDGVSQALFV